MKYNLLKPWLSLDPWQNNVLTCVKSTSMNLCIISGRKCGKSTVVAIMAAQTALNNKNEFILIGSGVIDQAQLLFRKVKEYIFAKAKTEIVGRPTLNFIELKNGSKIFCVPIGDTGDSMRGYSATMIIIDEAALVPDRAWEAIEPVISVTKGRIVLLSTPQGKSGFFYKASVNKSYFTRQISARNCPRHSKEFLDQKEAELSPVAFATEYLGEFIDDYSRKFTDEWIDKVCILKTASEGQNNFLGIDVSGEGPGDTTFEGFTAKDKNIYQTTHIFSNKISGPDIERQIETLKNQYHYGRKSIGFDSGGIGSGVFQYMLENNNIKRCMVSLDNATRPIESGPEGRTKKLLKEYMYDTLEEMGWRGELKCLDDGAIKQSFRSIQIEFKKNGDRRYWGTYSHIVEGIVRATWLAKNKSLKLYIY